MSRVLGPDGRPVVRSSDLNAVSARSLPFMRADSSERLMIPANVEPVPGTRRIVSLKDTMAQINASSENPEGFPFSPGYPIPPIARGTRAIQWPPPVGYNLLYSPQKKVGIPNDILRMFARICAPIRIVIQQLIREVRGYDHDITPVDITDAAKGKKSTEPETDPKREKLRLWLKRPDTFRTWGRWLNMVLDDMLVIGAPAVARMYSVAGDPMGLLPIDSAIISPNVDAFGLPLQPPDAAYYQYAYGAPYREYTVDELMYLPFNEQTWSPFGMSPVEQTIVYVQLALNRIAWYTNYFSASSIPAGWGTVPEGWTPDQIKEFQAFWDEMFEGNTMQKHRVRWGPHGSTFQSIKQTPDWVYDFDEFILRVFSWAVGVSASPVAKSSSMGHGAEGLSQEALAAGTKPLQEYLDEIITGYVQDEREGVNLDGDKFPMGFGQKEYKHSWTEEREENKDQKLAEIGTRVKMGNMTQNEARTAYGDDPYDPEDFPDADRPMVLIATGFVPFQVEEKPEPTPAELAAAGAPPTAGGPQPPTPGQPPKPGEPGVGPAPRVPGPPPEEGPPKKPGPPKGKTEIVGPKAMASGEAGGSALPEVTSVDALLDAVALRDLAEKCATCGCNAGPQPWKRYRLPCADPDFEVWLVDGAYVESTVDPTHEFTQGSNGYAHPELCPENEIWIDDRLPAWEQPIVLEAHELPEIYLMRDHGFFYDEAHAAVNPQEAAVTREALNRNKYSDDQPRGGDGRFESVSMTAEFHGQSREEERGHSTEPFRWHKGEKITGVAVRSLNTGRVMSGGTRHGALANRLHQEEPQTHPSSMQHGFITSEGRFVTREQAGKREGIRTSEELDYRSYSKPKGDVAGHEFHGNQWVPGGGGGAAPARTFVEHAATHPDGFTLHPVTGQPEPSGHVVALGNNLSKIISEEEWEKNGEQHVREYLSKVRDAAAENDKVRFGGWHDAEHHEFVLDHVEVYPNTSAGREAAISAGRERDQQSIYHIDSGTVIPTGGTGGRDKADQAGDGDREGRAEDDRQAARPHGEGDLPEADAAEKGDVAGHEFHGNQYEQAASEAHDASAKAKDASERARIMGTQQSHLDARRAHGEAAKAHAWAEKLSRTDQDAEHHHQQAEKHGRSAERHTYLAREASRSSWGEARAEARSARGARAGVEDKEPQKGDVEGHEFHGNQHTGGMGRLAPVADKADRVHLNSRVNEFPQKIQDKMNAECKARLGVTPEEMRDNALAAAEKCSEKDIADGKAWYQEAHDFNSKLADDTKLHPEIVTAVTAATSAGQRWEDNKEISQTICRSVTSDEIRGTGIDKETSEYLAIRGVNVEEGTKMGDLFDNNPHAAAIALQYQNGWAAGRGYDGIEKAIVLAGHNDVSRIDSELGGPKIRSFFNCMSDPAGNREDVCIDSHAYDILVNGAGSQEGYDRMASLHEGNPHLGNTPTYQGVRVGVYPVAADAFRQAADKYNEIHGTKLSYHEFQAMTWIRQGRVYPDSAMKEITMRSEIGQYKGDEE